MPTRASTCWTPIRCPALSKCFQRSQQPQEVCTLSDFTLQTQNLRQEGGSPSMQPGWRHLHHAKHLHREGPPRSVSPPSGGSLTHACAHTHRKSTELGLLRFPRPRAQRPLSRSLFLSKMSPETASDTHAIRAVPQPSSSSEGCHELQNFLPPGPHMAQAVL